MEDDPSEGTALQAVAHPSRRAAGVVALAALAVLAVALVTKQAAPPTSAPTQGIEPPPSAAGPVASPGGEAVAPAAAPSNGPPSRNSAAVPHPTYAVVPAEAGTIGLLPAGPVPVRVSVVLPTGWDRLTDAMYVRPATTPVALSIGAWRLGHVYTFPCRWSAAAYADPSLLGTAEGQAVALSSWWGQDPGTPPLSNSGIAPLASKPVQTTIAGYPAWYVEVLIPTGLDFTECDGRQLILWDATNGDVRYSLGPSEVNRLWVVDMDRGPIVIDAGMSLAASGSQKAELQAVIDSIAIEP
jgi:hypothetical protein